MRYNWPTSAHASQAFSTWTVPLHFKNNELKLMKDERTIS